MKKESEEISREEIAALLARESMSEKLTREQARQIVSEIRDIDGFPLDDKKALNMAIAALSAEPCDDAISRQAAIDAILTKYTEYERLKMLHFTPNIIKQECADLLTDLPSVTPKQSGWIPVSERLPKEGKTVIASTKDGVYPEAKYTKEYGWEWAYEAGADYWIELENVTAWMPLPTKYEPQESEGKE